MMSRQPHRPGPRDAELIAAWEAALAERGWRLGYEETGNPDALWSVDAVAADGQVASNGMGDTQAEALEVLVWNLIGHDPIGGDLS